MKIINLLPKSEQKETKLQFFARSQLSFWTWVLVSLVVFFVLAFGVKFYLNQVHAQTERDISLKREVLRSSDNEILRQQVDELNVQVDNIENIQSQRLSWSAALEELANLFAPDITMDLISLNRQTGVVNVRGTAASRESILRFWSDIHKSEYFTNINFPLSNLERATDTPFSFTFSVKLDKLKPE